MQYRALWPSGSSRRAWVWLAVAAAAVAGCELETHEPRQVEPSTLALRLPSEYGALTRPAVDFNHGRHVQTLTDAPCTECHGASTDGKLVFAYGAVQGVVGRDALMDQYHAACTGCHQRRAEQQLETGPVTCGECHVRQAPATSLRAPLRFDASLHARHVQAEQDACERCHHVLDEASGKLVYRKNTESACRDCHGDIATGNVRSLEDAAHGACVNCHLTKLEQGKPAGPTDCVGCHDPARQQAIEKLAEVPRLQRGQPDHTWVRPAAQDVNLVAFDHRAHEAVAESCSSCHHDTIASCTDCHTQVGDSRGAGVTLERAHHLASSRHACVGCHAAETAKPACAGCHGGLPRPPAEGSCRVCHAGPLASPGALAMPAPALPEPAVPPLPDYSPNFPETVVLDRLSGVYGPSELPHGKIVTALRRLTADSRLAARFHRDTGVFCSGCHHHGQQDSRPTECGSCHGSSSLPTEDKPDLQVAYHRQCIGCHQRMGIDAVGCTDCHAESAK